ncbi:MAG: hypothetical protein PGN12_09405 [Sphingomonas phyllosphaerae]
MASVAQVVAAAGTVSDAMYAMSGRALDFDRRQIVLTHHLRLVTVMRDFSASPAHGGDSPTYDPLVTLCRDATTVVGAADPQDDRSLNAALTACDKAAAAIDVATSRTVANAAGEPRGKWALRGALRVGPEGRGGMAAQGAPGEAGGREQMLAQLAKLFPAEALSVYPAGAAFLRMVDVPRWWFALVVAVAVAWVRWIATQPVAGGRPQYAAVIAAVVSFLIWVVMLGDWILPGNEPTQAARAVAAALALVWAWIAPQVVARVDGVDKQGA